MILPLYRLYAVSTYTPLHVIAYRCSNNIISASLCISTTASVLTLVLLTCRIAHVSVCVCASVCPSESVLWQNGWVDPYAVWDGEWDQLNDGRIRWVVIVEGEGAVLGVNFGRPTVTNGDYDSCARAMHSSQITLRTCLQTGCRIYRTVTRSREKNSRKCWVNKPQISPILSTFKTLVWCLNSCCKLLLHWF